MKQSEQLWIKGFDKSSTRNTSKKLFHVNDIYRQVNQSHNTSRHHILTYDKIEIEDSVGH